MIADDSQIPCLDGMVRPAIEIYPGREVRSFRQKKAVVRARRISNVSDVIGLILSNGEKLTGVRGQMVCGWSKTRHFRKIEDLEIGDRLVGSQDGVQTVVYVTGILYTGERQHRVVDFVMSGPYIASGVVCL